MEFVRFYCKLQNQTIQKTSEFCAHRILSSGIGFGTIRCEKLKMTGHEWVWIIGFEIRVSALTEHWHIKLAKRERQQAVLHRLACLKMILNRFSNISSAFHFIRWLSIINTSYGLLWTTHTHKRCNQMEIVYSTLQMQKVSDQLTH